MSTSCIDDTFAVMSRRGADAYMGRHRERFDLRPPSPACHRNQIEFTAWLTKVNGRTCAECELAYTLLREGVTLCSADARNLIYRGKPPVIRRPAWSRPASF